MTDTGPALTLIATDADHGDEVGTLRRRILDLEELLALIEAAGRADGSIRHLLRDCLDDCHRRLLQLEQRESA